MQNVYVYIHTIVMVVLLAPRASRDLRIYKYMYIFVYAVVMVVRLAARAGDSPFLCFVGRTVMLALSSRCPQM